MIRVVRAMVSNVPIKLIGTHNGKFHCDEALACYMLKCLPEYSCAEVVRSRDPTVLERCDVVVDVGGVYDPSIHRYDHHQRSFSESMNSLTGNQKPWVTKLSSAGLVYLHFGKRVINQFIGDSGSNLDVEDIENFYDYLYTNFVEEVDGVDNGIESYDGTRRYIVSTTISSRVSNLNSPWNSTNQDNDVQFKKAMELVGCEFRDRIMYYRDVLMPARSIVKEAIAQRLNVDSSGEIIVLNPSCPWPDHLFMLEKTNGIENTIKYVLYRDNVAGNWRVQAVAVEPNSFESRMALYEKWRGLRDERLSKMSGISGCIFVHSTGFIGGNTTYDGALQMATKSLELQKKQ